MELLHAPLHSWDEDAFWQLATCEYALDHLDDVDSSPKQLQLSFRAACEMVRNPLHVPRLRGSTRIDALHDALHAFERLRGELVHKLGVFKRFGRLLLADDGLRALSVRRSRARRVVAGAHETHARGHTEMAAAGAAAHREARSDLEGEWPLHGGVAQRHVPAGDEGDEGDEGDDDGEQVDGKPPEGDGAKPPKASMRWRLVEHLNDVVYAIEASFGRRRRCRRRRVAPAPEAHQVAGHRARPPRSTGRPVAVSCSATVWISRATRWTRTTNG